MIRVENLSKRFGTLEVLKGASTQIEKGEIISIIGPSGTGKSTFLRCLNLLERPESGRIFIDGADILAHGTDVPRLRRRMGMVFQSFNLYAHLNILDNLTIGPRKLLGQSREEAEKAALDTLEMVGIQDKARSMPAMLSGGQKQRAAIARCLMMSPEILLFDEPTSALDPTMVSEVLAVIRRLAKTGITMLIVTHEMQFAQDVSTRVFYMDEGIIYEEGPPAKLFGAPDRDKTRAFIHRIRAFTHVFDAQSHDLYGATGAMESFLEKHAVPRQTLGRAALLLEEVLTLYRERYPAMQHPLTLTVSYSEKENDVSMAFSHSAPGGALLSGADEIAVALIRGMCAEVCEGAGGLTVKVL